MYVPNNTILLYNLQTCPYVPTMLKSLVKFLELFFSMFNLITKNCYATQIVIQVEY